MRQVLGAIAQYERALIRSRMAAGRAAKLATGGYSGGRPPFGWRAEGKELLPDEREQEVIALARRLATKGSAAARSPSALKRPVTAPKSGSTGHPFRCAGSCGSVARSVGRTRLRFKSSCPPT